MDRRPGVQSVERALDLIEALDAAGRAMSVSELAAAIGLPAGTIHRLLRTLVDRGYAHQLPDRRYA
ncbi:helix-turn-helix domain-containing protein, partial [Glycomyces tenuis]